MESASVPKAEARAAGAGGRCEPPKRPETAFQTAGEPRRLADLGNMSIRPAVRCGRRAAVRLLGARDGGCGAAAVSEESREKVWRGRKKKGRNGIPELPDGRLASKTTDSCFPLIYLQQEETEEKRESERESRCVVPDAERSATSSPLLCLRAAAPSTGTCALSAAGLRRCVCGRGLCALTPQSTNWSHALLIDHKRIDPPRALSQVESGGAAAVRACVCVWVNLRVCVQQSSSELRDPAAQEDTEMKLIGLWAYWSLLIRKDEVETSKKPEGVCVRREEGIDLQSSVSGSACFWTSLDPNRSQLFPVSPHRRCFLQLQFVSWRHLTAPEEDGRVSVLRWNAQRVGSVKSIRSWHKDPCGLCWSDRILSLQGDTVMTCEASSRHIITVIITGAVTFGGGWNINQSKSTLHNTLTHSYIISMRHMWDHIEFLPISSVYINLQHSGLLTSETVVW